MNATIKKEAIDRIEEFKRAMCLRDGATKDNIWVVFKRIDGALVYRVNKFSYQTYAAALNHVQFLQSQIVYTRDEAAS